MGLDADMILSITQLSFITSIEPALKTFISSRVCMKSKERLSAAWLDKRPDITILSEYISCHNQMKLAINSWQPLNAKRSIKREQSGVTYWQLKLHNSETDRQVSIKCCGNYILLQGTCVALFTKIGQADWKQKYDAFLAIKCKMELKCIPIAEISPSCRKSRSPNPSALSEF